MHNDATFPLGTQASDVVHPSPPAVQTPQPQTQNMDWLYTNPQWVDALVQGYQEGRYGWVWQHVEGLLPPVNTPEALEAWEPQDPALSGTHVATLLYIAGLTLAQLGRAAEGQQYLAFATLKNPTAWDWQVHRALVCVQAKNPEEALAVIEHVLKHQRHHVLAQETLAQIYHQLGRLEASEERFSKLLQKHPQNTSARYHYALMLHTARRDFVAARHQYERVLAHAPRMIEARLNLAMLLHEHLQAYQEAETHYHWLLTQESLQESQRLDVLKGLASSAYSQGRTEVAVQYLSEAVRIPSGMQAPELWQQLAQWCWSIGQGEEAQQCEYALLQLAYAQLYPQDTHPELHVGIRSEHVNIQSANMSKGLWIYLQYLEQQKNSARMEQGRDACERLLQHGWDRWIEQYQDLIDLPQAREAEPIALPYELQDTLLAWANLVGVYGQFCEALGDSFQAKQAYLQQQTLLNRLAVESPVIWQTQGDKQTWLANQGVWNLRTLTPSLSVDAQELKEITQTRQEAAEILYTRWQASGQAQATLDTLLAQHIYHHGGMRYGHTIATDDQENLVQTYQQWLKPLPPPQHQYPQWTPRSERPLRIGLWVTEGREQAFIDYYHGLCTHVLGSQSERHVCTLIGSRFSKLQMEGWYHGQEASPWYVHQDWIHPSADLQETYQTLQQYALDLLVWDEYGADPQSTWLPYGELAASQLTGWSKPTLTGIGHLSPLPPASSLPWIPPLAHQDPPMVLQDKLSARKHLGLPEAPHVKLIGSPYHPEKVSPELIEWCCEVIQEAEAQNLALRWLWREPAYPSLKTKWLQAIEDRVGPRAVQHILWLPAMGQARFLNVLRAMDALIEPPFAGGGRITYEALRVGTPVFSVLPYRREPHWHASLEALTPYQSLQVTQPEALPATVCTWLKQEEPLVEQQLRPALQHHMQALVRQYYTELPHHAQAWWLSVYQAMGLDV
ncbi:MAG: tetratricopeptide repeat protein [Vampirovibrionales bacterium]